jgi:hypothetical protein
LSLSTRRASYRPHPSTPPILLTHSLHVHLQTRSITASKFISELHDCSLQMHLQTRSITASKCISELHDRGLEMHLQTRSIATSKCMSEFNLISASNCISKLTRLRPRSASLSSRPPSPSPNSLDHGLQVHPPTRSISDSKCISKHARLRPPNSVDHGLEVYLQTRSITILECISQFT